MNKLQRTKIFAAILMALSLNMVDAQAASTTVGDAGTVEPTDPTEPARLASATGATGSAGAVGATGAKGATGPVAAIGAKSGYVPKGDTRATGTSMTWGWRI